MNLLHRIVPAGIAGSESREPVSGALFPEEEVLVARVVEKRRAELVAGRVLARRAIATLGGAPVALPADDRGVPRWPAGLVGSITHTHGYVAAAVAPTSALAALGIDAEHLARVKPEIVHLIATSDEQAWISRLPDGDPRPRTLLFSAKEAAYKCQFPSTREVFDFLDATVTVDDRELLAGEGSFRVAFRTDLACASLSIRGRFAIDATHVVTAAWIAALPAT